MSDTLGKWIEITMRNSMRSIFKFSKENDLSMPQLGALMQIHRMGTCNVSHIGTDLGVTSAAASQLLDRMVQQELIKRSEDPNDRRVKQHILTDKGIELLHEGFHASQKWLEDSVNTLTNEERQQTVIVLKRLIEKAKNFDGESNSEEKS